jgi:hypothetical protein
MFKLETFVLVTFVALAIAIVFVRRATKSGTSLLRRRQFGQPTRLTRRVMSALMLGRRR